MSAGKEEGKSRGYVEKGVNEKGRGKEGMRREMCEGRGEEGRRGGGEGPIMPFLKAYYIQHFAMLATN
jgi:hypothetical protein